mmetsp:Transcript_93768/g.180931  ORF Transcript_93768/g.180931 Transcript_93768/m.180931 type:complete len:268 (-) Transcript_93768:4-807(-)
MPRAKLMPPQRPQPHEIVSEQCFEPIAWERQESLPDREILGDLTPLMSIPLRATGGCKRRVCSSCTHSPKVMKMLRTRSLPSAPPSRDALAKFRELDARMVKLNVYDVTRSCLVGAFNHASLLLIKGGIFHVAVEVWHREYSFGSGDRGSGVACKKPRRDTDHTYRRSVELGQTELSAKECQTVAKRLAMAEDWQGRRYNTLVHNCTHFARKLVSELGVTPVPDWVDRLGRVAEGLIAPLDAALVACWTRRQDSIEQSEETWCEKAI